MCVKQKVVWRRFLESTLVLATLLNESSSYANLRTYPNPLRQPTIKAFEADYEQQLIRREADGKLMRQFKSGRFSRDAYGRTREEMHMETAPQTSLSVVLIADPVQHCLFVLNADSRTFTKRGLPTNQVAVVSDLPVDDGPAKPDDQPENLGKQRFDGILCDGYRVRFEDSTREYWYSETLGAVLREHVTSKREEKTFRLFNIRQVEPDPVSFTVPANYLDAADARVEDRRVPPAGTRDVYGEDKDNQRVFLWAATNGDTETVKELLAKGVDVNGRSDNDDTALIRAAFYGRTNTVKLLLNNGAAIESKNRIGMTALMRAASEGYTDIVETLVAAGANLNTTDVGDQTALILAAALGRVSTLKVLLAAGADVNAKTKAETTALMLASGQGDSETVKTLLAAGADASAKTKDGLTALTIAERAGYKKVVEVLKAAGEK